jgi:hypothetical protein
MEEKMFNRILPALILLVLTPVLAEYMLGDVEATFLQPLVLLLPMYGGGALFIREITRRTGRGWPTILLLGLAYGLLEEGLGDFTLFSSSFMGIDLNSYGHVPALGIGLPWTLFCVPLHAVWSIAAPIALVEALFPDRRTTPWLGKFGLAASGVLWLGGVGVLARTFAMRTHFVPSPAQIAVSLAIIAALAAAAFLLFKPRSEAPAQTPGAAPAPLVVGLASLLLGSAYWAFYHYTQVWHAIGPVPGVIGFLLLDAAALAYFFTVSRRAGWSDLHRFALMSGPVLTYGWYGFVNLEKLNGPESFPSHSVLVGLFVLLLVFAWTRVKDRPA